MSLLALLDRDLDYLDNEEDYHDDDEREEVEAGIWDKYLLVIVIKEFLLHPFVLVLLRDPILLKMHLDL